MTKLQPTLCYLLLFLFIHFIYLLCFEHILETSTTIVPTVNTAKQIKLV